ncbi:hypothetical protein [Streptomyces sp. T21Q-yed]|uniref:hypothetical protein n=1 Tax=Streptomyces sp. T21Q-yed TaxID=3018441 RepID=UPI0023DFEB7B|nr:hypothetical protein [Streptomyces sp. T21Q-yed]MDF3143794.1 hypothetical protein [Streptomyces sp. T21Q-yed]
MTGVYGPRLRAFEYTLATLGVALDEIVHVSASPMYDLRSAATLGIKNRTRCPRTAASSTRVLARLRAHHRHLRLPRARGSQLE